MPNKTSLRKRSEANEKANRAARAEYLADAKNDLSLKPNAQKNAKKYKG